MKSTFLKYCAFVLVAGICALACKKSNFIVDKDPLIPGAGAHFVVKPAIPATAPYYTFSIGSTPAPGTVYKLPVGLTNVANVDRTVNFTYTSRTAVNGTQYTAPASLTIKAGTVLDTLRIQGLFSGYTTPGRKDTLTVKIAPATAGSVANVGYQDSLILVLQKVCPLDINDFSGNFVVVKDGWQDTNPGDIIVLSKVDATHFSFTYPTILNPVPAGIVVTVDPATNNVSIAKQAPGTEWNYGGGYLLPTVRSTGVNTISPCDKTVTLSLLWGYNGAEYGAYAFTLKKQ